MEFQLRLNRFVFTARNIHQRKKKNPEKIRMEPLQRTFKDVREQTEWN